MQYLSLRSGADGLAKLLRPIFGTPDESLERLGPTGQMLQSYGRSILRSFGYSALNSRNTSLSVCKNRASP